MQDRMNDIREITELLTAEESRGYTILVMRTESNQTTLHAYLGGVVFQVGLNLLAQAAEEVREDAHKSYPVRFGLALNDQAGS